MLNGKQIRKIEKQTEKRLRKHFTDTAYFAIDEVKFGMTDKHDDHIVLYARAGYTFKDEEDTEQFHQITMEFSNYTGIVRNAGEFAAVLFVKIVEKLDGWNSFVFRK